MFPCCIYVQLRGGLFHQRARRDYHDVRVAGEVADEHRKVRVLNLPSRCMRQKIIAITHKLWRTQSSLDQGQPTAHTQNYTPGSAVRLQQTAKNTPAKHAASRTIEAFYNISSVTRCSNSMHTPIHSSTTNRNHSHLQHGRRYDAYLLRVSSIVTGQANNQQAHRTTSNLPPQKTDDCPNT